MSKIGIIWVGFNCSDYLQSSLRPWIEAKKQKLGGHEYLIYAVSVPFEGFGVASHDDTRLRLYDHLQNGEIDNLLARDEPMKETAARGEALRWLVQNDCDLLWQWDSDEFTDHDEIQRVLRFVDARPQIVWFKGSYKNVILDGKTYLAQPFNPPRIHRVHPYNSPYRAHSFYDDNNILYGGTITRNLVRDVDFAHVTIPKSVQFSRHLTWLSDARGKAKSAYQLSRGWVPSFLWSEEKNGLIFNPALPIPETEQDLI